MDKQDIQLQIFDSIQNNDYKMTKNLLENGANPNNTSKFKDSRQDSLLIHAIKKGNLEIIRELLKFGAEPNYFLPSNVNKLKGYFDKDNPGIDKLSEGHFPYPPLYYAINIEDKILSQKIIRLLIQYGANPFVKFNLNCFKDSNNGDPIFMNCKIGKHLISNNKNTNNEDRKDQWIWNENEINFSPKSLLNIDKIVNITPDKSKLCEDRTVKWVEKKRKLLKNF